MPTCKICNSFYNLQFRAFTVGTSNYDYVYQIFWISGTGVIYGSYTLLTVHQIVIQAYSTDRHYLFAKGHLHPKLQNDVKDKDLISCHLPGLLKLWKWSRTTSIRNSGQIEGNVNTTWFQLSIIDTEDLEMSWLIWISIMTSILIITVDSDTSN